MEKIISFFTLLAIRGSTLFIFLSCATPQAKNLHTDAFPTRRLSNTSLADFQDGQISERITSALKPQIGIKNVGVIVAIYDRGTLQFLSFGETSRGNRLPPSPDTLFEIGSITKTFTGLMLSRSIDLGRLKSTDSIDHFKKQWKGQKTGSITLIELVTHRSGLPRLPCNLHYSDPHTPYLDYSESDLIRGLTDSSMSFQNCDLENHPTLEINYSNWGMAMIGYVMAHQQNKTYESLLYELILDPLKLTDSTITLNIAQNARLATGYDQNLIETPPWSFKVLLGHGAIKSTARDLINYAKAYLHPEKTSIESSIRRASQTEYPLPTGGIGYAWFTKPSESIWHNGMTGGFNSFIKIYPKRELAVLYLTNTAREPKCFMESIENVACDPLAED